MLGKFTKIIKVLAKYLLAIMLIYYFWSKNIIDFGLLIKVFERPKYLFILLGCYFSMQILQAFRLKLLLKPFEEKLKVLTIYILNYIGLFFNCVLPGSVSGDLVKIYYLKKRCPQLNIPSILLALFMDRLSGLVALFFYASVSLCFLFVQNINLGDYILFIRLILIFLLAFLLFIVALFLFPLKWYVTLEKLIKYEKIKNIFQAFHKYRLYRTNLLGAFIISLVVQGFFLLGTFIVARFLIVLDIPVFPLIAATSLGIVTTAIPIVPGGLGVGHMAFQELYEMMGYNSGANIFNIWIILVLMVNLLGIFFYLFYKDTK